MDPRVYDYIEQVAQSVVGLDVALFYQANPGTFDTAAGVALRTHRDVGEVEAVLARMTEHGFLESFQRGDGRYICYALAKDPHVWNLLCLLSEAFLDRPESRKEIVRILMRRQAELTAARRAAQAEEDSRA